MSRGTRMALIVGTAVVVWAVGMSFAVPLSHDEDTKNMATALILIITVVAIGGGAIAALTFGRRR